MNKLSCPVPSNINPLQNNGFLFNITKLPELKYFCQEVNLPNLDLQNLEFANPLVTVPIPGDQLRFGELGISFMIDENMDNYIAIHNWMIGLGFPESHEQYRNFISNNTDDLARNELVAGYSGGVLHILDSANNSARAIEFVDLSPVSLNQIQLQSTDSSTTYLVGTAGFTYTYYKFI